jgi:hypothetical protein
VRKLVPFAVCGILLAGCASSESESILIRDDTAVISVLSQGAGDRAKLVDKAIAEAAKMTRANGYRYFVILDTADASHTVVKIRQGAPVQIQSVPGVASGGSALSSNYIGGPGYTTPDRRVSYVRVGVDMTIRMYRDGEVDPASPGVWNSDIVQGGK